MRQRLTGDVEEGNLTTANSHGGAGAVTSDADQHMNNKATKVDDSAKEEAKEEKSSHSKEKSVLQAKLTKLAIQIGYAGMRTSLE